MLGAFGCQAKSYLCYLFFCCRYQEASYPLLLSLLGCVGVPPPRCIAEKGSSLPSSCVFNLYLVRCKYLLLSHSPSPSTPFLSLSLFPLILREAKKVFKEANLKTDLTRGKKGGRIAGVWIYMSSKRRPPRSLYVKYTYYI